MTSLKQTIISLLLSISILCLTCIPAYCEEAETETEYETLSEEEVYEPEFKQLNDPALLQYVEDKVYADLVNQFQSEDYIIENVEAVYISKEYLEELEYNSLGNVWFGYSLPELMDQFNGEKFIFTLGEDNETTVEPFEDYDDTYERVLRNVAIGTGVILVCVTVSVVTAGAGLPCTSLVFAASAKTGAVMALSSGSISAIAVGTINGIKTGDFDEAIKAGALAGSESFKWGAIAGAITGGASILRLKYPVDDYPYLVDDPDPDDYFVYLHELPDGPYIDDPNLPQWRNAELRALSEYGGSEQLAYLDGVEVPFNTAGSTRPDIVTMVGDHIEAIEVKYYNFESTSCLNEMYSELEREVAARVINLPADATQRIVLDVTGRNFSEELIQEVTETVQYRLYDIYPDIPVDIMDYAL